MDPVSVMSMQEELEKIAVFRQLWEGIKNLFRGEDARAKSRADQVLDPDVGKDRWRKVPQFASSASFVKQIQKSPLADAKLKKHVQSMHDLSKARTVGKIQSSGGRGKSYEVKKLPGGRLGCTCPDWRYKGSVSPSHKCKHVRAYESKESPS